MTTSVASFNVENLFSRPRAFSAESDSAGERVIADYREFNALIGKAIYTDADRTRMRELLLAVDVYYLNQHGAIRRKVSSNPTWAWLRKNRGKFDREPTDTTLDVVVEATGRRDWIGWLELATEAVNEIGTRMTARVISELNADIVAIVEAEDRPSMIRLNTELLARRYRHLMLVDGNDERGIDVGLLTKAGFPIESIRSHVDLFAGRLNEGPPAVGQPPPNLARLFDPVGPLVSCYDLPGFDVGSRPGTFAPYGLRDRLDYVLLSRSLEPAFVGGRIFRKGIWGDRVTRPTAWETYPEMTESVHQASDHAAVVVELDL